MAWVWAETGRAGMGLGGNRMGLIGSGADGNKCATNCCEAKRSRIKDIIPKGRQRAGKSMLSD